MYAYAPDGVVADLCAQVPAVHPDLAAQYRPVPDALVGRIAIGWIASGTGYAPPAATPALAPVPQAVSAAQAMICLHRQPSVQASAPSSRTLLDDVEAAVEAAGMEARLWFAKAQTWQRQAPTVLALAAALGLDAERVDTLFRTAAAIEA